MTPKKQAFILMLVAVMPWLLFGVAAYDVIGQVQRFLWHKGLIPPPVDDGSSGIAQVLGASGA